MQIYLVVATILIAAPVAAQTTPQTDPRAMSGMNHDGMAGTNHDAMRKPAKPMPAMGHPMLGGMGEMMKNTPANPYAEAGMAMHHKMMVVGADASETWVRQMIEHHRGAIAMSKIAVAQAKDKDVRALAQQDITLQERDIASLRSWLKQHGHAAQ